MNDIETLLSQKLARKRLLQSQKRVMLEEYMPIKEELETIEEEIEQLEEELQKQEDVQTDARLDELSESLLAERINNVYLFRLSNSFCNFNICLFLESSLFICTYLL